MSLLFMALYRTTLFFMWLDFFIIIATGDIHRTLRAVTPVKRYPSDLFD